MFPFTVVVIFRKQLAKLKVQWNNVRRTVKSYLNEDWHPCRDLIMIGAGIYRMDGAEPWKRNCMALYRWLGFYQFIMSLAKAGFSVHNQHDLVQLYASIWLAMGTSASYAKVFIMEHYREVIEQSEEFINGNNGHSDDPDYDASVRKDAAGMLRKMMLSFLIIIGFEQVLLWFPSSARERILGIPKQLHVFELVAAQLMEAMYVVTLCIFYGYRFYWCSLTVTPVLVGLRSELMIVARSYETVESRVQARICEDQTHGNESYWPHLKQIVGTTVEQHIEVLRQIHLVQPVVSNVYAFIYYTAMLFVSFPLVLVIRGEPGAISIVLAFATVAILLECYWWCHLIELIQETMERIAGVAVDLSSGLPHSKENHSEYIQMRTSLMIIQLNASQCYWFSCGGVFPISVESFGELCMIIYRFATFLLNFD